MRRASQQGALDGLCGVYALVHFLRRFEYFRGYDERPEREAFWCVLETAERLGLLRANYVYDGYTGQNLRTILNQIISDLELPHTTHLIPYAAQQLGINRFKELADRALAKDAALVSTYSKGCHWVFVHAVSGANLKIDNSSGVEPKDQVLTPRQCGTIDLKDGILILPENVSLSEL